MELNTIKDNQTWGQAAASLNENFSKVRADMEKVKNATTRNKGYFKTIDALESAFPSASEGDKAYVGATYPYTVYNYIGGAWTTDGATGGDERVDLGDYYTKEDIETINAEYRSALEKDLAKEMQSMRQDVENIETAGISFATESKLGGVKAAPRTDTYVQEVRIDPATGKLFVPKGEGTPPDDEDLTIANASASKVLRFKDRDTSQGKGYVILRTGKPLADQMTEGNTVYEIRYDFNLEDDTLNVPDDCVLYFNGGSIRNGAIVGNRTFIKSYNRQIFKEDITLSGTFANSSLFASFFGVDRGQDVTSELQSAISNADSSGIKKLILDHGSYYVSGTITIPPRMDFGGIANESLASWKYTGEVPTILQTVNAPVFSVSDNEIGTRNISIHDIAIRASADYSGSKDDLHGIYAESTINVVGCSFRNIFIEGLRFGMYFNVVNGGGFTENTFINVGALRNTIGIFIDSATTTNRAWFNHNYFRLCYLNENVCGAVYVKNIQSIQTLLFLSCNFEQNGRGYNESDYADYGCFGFRAGSMLYGCVLFDSCYFEGTVPRSTEDVNEIYPSVNYAKEGHVVFNGGQVEIRNSIVARTRQFVTVGSTGKVFLSKNEYYLTTRINDTFSTCLVRYLGITGGGKTTSLVIKEPSLGLEATYIDRPYEFNYASYSSTNTFYQGNLDIDAPAFQREIARYGVYEPDVTFYVDAINGNDNFNGLSKAHPLKNFSSFRYYGTSRYARAKDWNVSLQSDITGNFGQFGNDAPIIDKNITINGNGHTLTVPDRSIVKFYNTNVHFKNCNLIFDNQTAYYNILLFMGKCNVTFEGCTITFSTGSAVNFITCLSYSLLNCTFNDSSVSVLSSPSSDFYLVRMLYDSMVKVFKSSFSNGQNLFIMANDSITDAFINKAETNGGWNNMPMVRRGDDKVFVYSDAEGKLHNSDGTYISNVTII